MSPVRRAPTPRTALYRIGRLPDPLAWPPREYIGSGRLRLATGQRWLDLRSMETREVLRNELARTLISLELEDLDLSGVVGPRRRLTQAIERWSRMGSCSFNYLGLQIKIAERAV